MAYPAPPRMLRAGRQDREFAGTLEMPVVYQSDRAALSPLLNRLAKRSKRTYHEHSDYGDGHDAGVGTGFSAGRARAVRARAVGQSRRQSAGNTQPGDAAPRSTRFRGWAGDGAGHHRQGGCRRCGDGAVLPRPAGAAAALAGNHHRSSGGQPGERHRGRLTMRPSRR